MGILKCDKFRWDKKCILGYVIALIIAIICGIVLFKLNFSSYSFIFADNYVFYVFNFNNGSIFAAHILSELFYLYAVFLICYFTKLKFLAFIIFFIRATFFTLYTFILFGCLGAEGIIVGILVFVPSFLFSAGIFIFLCEQCRCICAPYSFLAPAVFALLSCIFVLLLVNVLFRVVVVIV